MDWEVDKPKTRTLFLVLPYADRETLSHEVRERRQEEGARYPYFTEKEVIYIVKRLLELVDKLNNQLGIVHRDIKPDNIFLHENVDNEHGFTLSLGDFGMAWNAKKDDYPDLKMPYHVLDTTKGEQRCIWLQRLHKQDLGGMCFWTIPKTIFACCGNGGVGADL